MEAHYEEVKAVWEDRFEKIYGRWRGFIDHAIWRYLDCGIEKAGFARLKCCDCGRERLLTLSCKQRGICPSCDAKRAAAFAAFLQDELLENVGHSMWTFTIPKMLRPYFMNHRELLAGLARLAYETIQEFKISILYDNYRFLQRTKTDWDFSYLIEGTEKSILLDTGTLPEIFPHNVEQLKVDLDKIDTIVISHNHEDHAGGLFTVLEKNPSVSVYLPYSVPYDFVRRVENMKAEVISVQEPVRICKNVFSTGEMGGGQIEEQSLIINTSKGLIIVTGCSHQGILNILKKAKNIFDKIIYLVAGGFHLHRNSDDEVRDIIREFKEIEVIKCGASHCIRERAISLFKDAFGENYVQIGTERYCI